MCEGSCVRQSKIASQAYSFAAGTQLEGLYLILGRSSPWSICMRYTDKLHLMPFRRTNPHRQYGPRSVRKIANTSICCPSPPQHIYGPTRVLKMREDRTSITGNHWLTIILVLPTHARDDLNKSNRIML